MQKQIKWYKLPDNEILFYVTVTGEGVTVNNAVTVGQIKADLPREYWLYSINDLYYYYNY
jgi:hypothetical protein